MKHSPFTTLCGQLARLDSPHRADLHIHTTASDGEFTPSQVVAFARQAKLAAVAITDHDTLAGIHAAQDTAHEELEVIPGVEISATFQDREVHLLGYFVRTDHPGLQAEMTRLCERRRERFRSFIALLSERGIRLPEDRARYIEDLSPSLGRRHVASLLVASQVAKSLHEAFQRFLHPITRQVLPKVLLPVEQAIHLVREAGGVASLAHPSPELVETDFRSLAEMGLAALEVVYPWGRHSPAARLREIAAGLGLAITGGSDCHGANPAHRKIGSYTISQDELHILRELRTRSDYCASQS